MYFIKRNKSHSIWGTLEQYKSPIHKRASDIKAWCPSRPPYVQEMDPDSPAVCPGPQPLSAQAEPVSRLRFRKSWSWHHFWQTQVSLFFPLKPRFGLSSKVSQWWCSFPELPISRKQGGCGNFNKLTAQSVFSHFLLLIYSGFLPQLLLSFLLISNAGNFNYNFTMHVFIPYSFYLISHL